MKKIFAFIAAIIIAIISYADGEGVVPISVQDATSQSDPVHRTIVPIEAYYIAFNSSICVTFSQNLGDMDVTVTNLTTGDSDDFEIVASIGSTLLPISGDTGYYRIDFILSSGLQYYGEFEITQ